MCSGQSVPKVESIFVFKKAFEEKNLNKKKAKTRKHSIHTNTLNTTSEGPLQVCLYAKHSISMRGGEFFRCNNLTESLNNNIKNTYK